MPTEITKAEYLEMYERGSIHEPIVITVGTETRLYGRTPEGATTHIYRVVYAVV